MFRLFNSLMAQHDWSLVLAAAMVCLGASLVAVHLVRRAQATAGQTRSLWVATAGAATGFGIWATHFVAMLAYEPGVPVGYAILPTALSLLIAVALTGLGLAVAISRMAWGAPLGGIIVALGNDGDTDLAESADHFIPIPPTNEFLLPILEVIPLQLLAYHCAVRRGCDIDQPRNLAKSVTVE